MTCFRRLFPGDWFGKKRIIDNRDTGEQSERSSDWNKLV